MSCHVISYHIIYHTISYYIIAYYIILYYIILYYIILYCIILYYIILYYIILYYNKFAYLYIHLLVISHEKRSVHGHESFKIVPPSHLGVSFVNKICRNLRIVLIEMTKNRQCTWRPAFVYARIGCMCVSCVYVCMYVSMCVCLYVGM